MEGAKSQRESPFSWWGVLSHAQLSGRDIMHFTKHKENKTFTSLLVV